MQSFELDTDPTLFGLMFQRFRTVFQELMSSYQAADLTSPGDQDAVRDFRALHLDSAYLCSFSGCPRSLSGFKTSSEREGHELSHTRQFRCPQIRCDFYVTGFTSRGALQKHCRKYHADLDQDSIPDLLGSLEPEKREIKRSGAFGDLAAVSKYRNAFKRGLRPDSIDSEAGPPLPIYKSMGPSMLTDTPVWIEPHIQEPIDLCNHIKRARLDGKKEIAHILAVSPARNEAFSPAFFLSTGVPFDPALVMRSFNEEDGESDCQETSQGPGEDQAQGNGSLSDILRRQPLHGRPRSPGDLTHQESAGLGNALQNGAEHIRTPLAESPGAASPEATMLSELEYGLEDDNDQPASTVLEYE